MNRAYMPWFLAHTISSQTTIKLSKINLSLTKPVCLGLIIFGKICFNRKAIALARILQDTFMRVIGGWLVVSSGSLGFRMNLINPYRCGLLVSDS